MAFPRNLAWWTAPGFLIFTPPEDKQATTSSASSFLMSLKTFSLLMCSLQKLRDSTAAHTQ